MLRATPGLDLNQAEREELTALLSGGKHAVRKLKWAQILLAAACPEGAGAPEFRRMLLEATSAEEFLESIKIAPVIVDQWQLEKLAIVATRQRVLWYTPGLPPEYHNGLWGRSYATIESAIEALTSSVTPGGTIAVIPEGPYVLAKAHAHEAVVC